MNYQRIYSDLIEFRKTNVPDGYSEKHHIIPKSMGGNNSKGNLVRLTAREHFIAHRLLAKIHGGRMWNAVTMMSSGNCRSANGLVAKSRIYEHARAKMSEGLIGEKHHNYGKRHSHEHRKKISEALLGEKSPMFGREFTPEHRAKLSEAKKGVYVGEKNHNYGKRLSDEQRARISAAKSGVNHQNYGKNLPPLTRSRISESLKNMPIVVCPHCLKEGKAGPMKRWHFDRCKDKP